MREAISEMREVAIIDYGMGNLRSVQKGFERVGVRAVVSRDQEQILRAAGVVLPGVGAFGACMANLRELGLIDTVRRVIENGTPFLGICLGMQLLFDESEEFGPVPGLGVLRGRCVRFRPAAAAELRVPHMGWNRIRKRQSAPHLDGVSDGAFVYFVHSFYVVPSDPAIIATTTDYDGEFASAVATRNIFACQFHPEKSQGVGLRMLRNFGRLVGAASVDALQASSDPR